MTTLTITAKGQVTLRREFLRHLGAAPGDKIVIDKRPNGVVEIRVARGGTGSIADVFGLLKRDDGPCLTIDEISEITAQGWAGEQ